ncbi:hypothetical protein C367_02212 [Cryptococcus neoformans Ze90-1]|nr:hypothetical protein C367_02212 [Cryptococcus neoformans var. grubii Ze90-1]
MLFQSDKRPRNALTSIFTESGHADILLGIFNNLAIKHIPALLRVNKYVNSVFTSSSQLQLRYRRSYHSVSPHTQTSASRRITNSAEELGLLIEQEKRLSNLCPSEIRCLHFPNAEIAQVQQNHILVTECINREIVFPNAPDSNYLWDGWSVWRIRNAYEFDGESRGGKKVQGVWKWKMNFGAPIDSATMCVEDNVVAVAYAVNQPPCDTISYNSTLKVAHRIYFYSLIPPVGTPQQSDDIFQPPIPHPEATLPYVEVLVPAKHHMHHIELQLGQDGKVGLLLVSADTTRQNFVGLWDWKAGVSVGKLSPTPDVPVCEDFRFMGPFILSSVMRDLVKKPEDELMVLHNRELDSSASGPRSSRLSDFTPQRYKPASVYDDIDYDSEEDIFQGVSEAIPPPLETVYSIDTYAPLPTERGTRPFKRTYTTHFGPGSEIDEAYTWDWDEIPFCMPLASLQLPALNTTPLGVYETPLDSIMDSLHVDTDFHPVRLAFESFSVDPALLRGERLGVIPFTMSGDTSDGLGAPNVVRCKGIIDIATLLGKTIEAMQWHMAKAKGIDIKLLALGAKLNKRTWRDQLIEAFELFLRSGQDDGWETEEDEPNRYKSKKNRSKRISRKPTITSPKQTRSTYKWEKPYVIPWKSWDSGVSVRFNHRNIVTAWGTRAVMVEPVPDAKPLVRKKDGQLMRQYWMTLRDYSRHTFHDHPGYPRQVLGGLQHPYLSLNKGSLSTASSSASPSAPESDAKREKLRVIKCSLVNPIPVAHMDNDLIEHSTSEIQDKRLWTKRIFYDELLQSKLMYKEVRAKILLDQKRPYRSSAFDGKMVVIGVESGAHIFTF